MAEISIGSVLGGYRIEGVAGEGGMGRVYRATQTGLNRQVALKVIAENGWFAARPSGTEDVYKTYAESFLGPDHLELILGEAESIVRGALEQL